MDGLQEDSSDSDPVVSASRRSRLATVRVDFEDSPGQTSFYASADYDEESDYDDIQNAEQNDIDGGYDGKEDAWSAFSQQLFEIETEANIRRLYPKCLHPDWKPQVQPCNEYEVLEQMISAEDEGFNDSFPDRCPGQGNHLPDYQEFVLHDFEVYVSVKERSRQGYAQSLQGHMLSLDVVAAQCIKLDFYFDGYVEHNGVQHYVHRAHIRDVNIGCLQERLLHSAKDHVYLQSEFGHILGRHIGESVWYRLAQPSMEYSEIFATFLWIADLAKHFVDYLTFKADAEEDVSLTSFEADFITSLRAWHGHDSAFQEWHTACAHRVDFRQHINRHMLFLHDRIWFLEDDQGARLSNFTLWRQIHPKVYSSRVGPKNCEESTVVTRNVFKAFCATFPKWGPEGFNLLRVVDPAPEVEKARRQRMQARNFPDKYGQSRKYHTSSGISLAADTLEKVGCADSRPMIDAQDIVHKVIIVCRNKSKESDLKFECSYAFVRGIVPHRRQKALSVVWFVHPHKTICGKAFYPHGNELFFSEECSCQPVLLCDVMAVYGISTFSDRAQADATFFAREKYSEHEECFTTARPSDLECTCQEHVSVEQDLASAYSRQTVKKEALRESPRLELKSMSLFCGSGLLDRGLEENQGFKTTYQIELDECAMQSCLANQTNPGEHVTGSVNYCLRRWLQGKDKIPDIHCCCSGCPCPGFSKMNNFKGSKNSTRKRSLLASTLSYAELFMPYYFLIENVLGMDDGEPSPCDQAVCCLVALGFQVLKLKNRADDIGGSTKRPRLFLFAAAPGLPFPPDPNIFASTGTATNVSDAIKGLAAVDNDTTVNLKQPDHIPLKRLQPRLGVVNLRRLVQKIPTFPPSQNLYTTYQNGLLDHNEIEWFLSLGDEKRCAKSKTLARIDPTKPFPTIATTFNELCARYGTLLHPFEDRMMTLEELKIALGVLIHYVLIGSLTQQGKQVANGVARVVGIAFGRAMMESWTAGHAQGLIVSKTPPATDSVRESPSESEDPILLIRKHKASVADRHLTDSSVTKAEYTEQGEAQLDSQTPVLIKIEDSNKEQSILSSPRDSPEPPFLAELKAAVPDQRCPSKRGKRMRIIPDSDSDNDNASDEEDWHYAITSPAVRRHMDGRRARKSAYSSTTREPFKSASMTAEEVIVLSD